MFFDRMISNINNIKNSTTRLNLYKYDNYNNKPREYCGINLNNTLLN